MKRVSLISVALLAGLFSHSAVHAMTRRVPGQYPTIQSAVDVASPSGDVILVAPGVYSESVVIVNKHVALRGEHPVARPSVRAVYWDTSLYPPRYSASLENISISDTLRIGSWDEPLSGTMTMQDCDVGGPATVRAYSPFSSLPLDLLIERCEFRRGLAASCNGSGAHTRVHSCDFHGGYVILTAEPYIEVSESRFTDADLTVYGGDGSRVIGNSLTGGAGLTVHGGHSDVLANHLVETQGGISVATYSASAQIISNALDRCGAGIAVMNDGPVYSYTVEHNQLWACTGGVAVCGATSGGAVRFNTMWNTSSGVRVQDTFASGTTIDVTSNSIIGCEADAISCIDDGGGYRIALALVANLIVGANTGVRLGGIPDVLSLTCNDVWDNDTNWIGTPDPTGSDGNISADPMFCGRPAGDLRISSESACIIPQLQASCAPMIGAWGVGCGTTSVAAVMAVPTTWGTLKQRFVVPRP